MDTEAGSEGGTSEAVDGHGRDAGRGIKGSGRDTSSTDTSLSSSVSVMIGDRLIGRKGVGTFLLVTDLEIAVKVVDVVFFFLTTLAWDLLLLLLPRQFLSICTVLPYLWHFWVSALAVNADFESSKLNL